jgi:hypothetical protein
LPGSKTIADQFVARASLVPCALPSVWNPLFSLPLGSFVSMKGKNKIELVAVSSGSNEDAVIPEMGRGFASKKQLWTEQCFNNALQSRAKPHLGKACYGNWLFT